MPQHKIGQHTILKIFPPSLSSLRRYPGKLFLSFAPPPVLNLDIFLEQALRLLRDVSPLCFFLYASLSSPRLSSSLSFYLSSGREQFFGIREKKVMRDVSKSVPSERFRIFLSGCYPQSVLERSSDSRFFREISPCTSSRRSRLFSLKPRW